MNANAVDSIIRYALAVAAESDDWTERELGPIHLIKYVYLADLAHAEIHGGETYTAAPWRFHHYGPWTEAVFERIEPAALSIDAAAQQFPASQFDRDFVRYRVGPDEVRHRIRELERALPAEVRGRVRRAVKEFGKDTQALLDAVYRTRPMLRAAPGEALRFDDLGGSGEFADRVSEPQPEPQLLTRKAEKRRAEAIAVLRARIQERLRERRAQNAGAPQPPPRYDEVFAEGQRQLDELAGAQIADGPIEAHFADAVWSSRGRSDTELS
jgi:hypothetical protein